MGRRDAVQFTLECVAEWRRMGALVTFEPGWERRGNGTSADYEGAVEHHTATPSSPARPFPTRNMLLSGRSDLPGPLCNDATPVGPGDRPHIHVIAAHPANHAGASGGRATAPLPVTRLFNPRVRGNEIDYAGDRPMTPGQYHAATIHGRGVVNVLRREVDYIKAHAETSITGKWDPGYAPGRTIDMAKFRRDAAALGTAPTPEDDMNADQDRKLNEIHWELRSRFPSRVAGSKYTDTPVGFVLNTDAASYRIERAIAAQQATIGELVKTVTKLAANGDDVDEAALLAAIGAKIDSAVKEIDASLDDAAKLVNVKVSVDDDPAV